MFTTTTSNAGTSEQRFDELKNGLHADRLSCHRFVANFWRLLLHTAAFNLLNWLRDDPHVPAELRTAQPATWRSRLIKGRRHGRAIGPARGRGDRRPMAALAELRRGRSALRRHPRRPMIPPTTSSLRGG